MNYFCGTKASAPGWCASNAFTAFALYGSCS